MNLLYETSSQLTVLFSVSDTFILNILFKAISVVYFIYRKSSSSRPISTVNEEHYYISERHKILSDRFVFFND